MSGASRPNIAPFLRPSDKILFDLNSTLSHLNKLSFLCSSVPIELELDVLSTVVNQVSPFPAWGSRFGSTPETVCFDE